MSEVLTADADLASRYRAVRGLSTALAAPLSDADASAQSMPDASPAKWHLAHTSWFFETFLLAGLPGYRRFDDRFGFLFNSYYEAAGPRHARPARGLLTRPSLDDVLAYRDHVDAAMLRRLADFGGEARALVDLGLNHEAQHQELLLTDVLDLFARNPLEPAMYPPSDRPPSRLRANGVTAPHQQSGRADAAAPIPGQSDLPAPDPSLGRAGRWRHHPGGIVDIGHGGTGFAFDCEAPRHQQLLRPYALATCLVSNADWQAFIAAGGYRDPALWLSDGWAWVNREGIAGPGHWRQDDDGAWTSFTLAGRRPLDPGAPVTHISFYEADAFASWAGARLPTEAEWEAVAAGEDADGGNQLDRPGPVRPLGGEALFGDCWQWTMSAFLPYPGFRAPAGAVGEYNGKFMNGQMVLKGASCATPRGSSRASVRNFFYPHMRWQFTGLRLAKDL